jgi:DNA-binding CsgD family transcriptional regulator/DNA-binding transcriptional ArsR family regulator
MLTALGATQAEDRVYRLLITTVSACEEEIAEGTGVSQDEVRRALASLVERGLVDRMPETPTRFVAASPSVVESMIAKRLTELRTAQQTLDGLTSQYRANSLVRTAGGVFEIIRGEDALRQCSLGLLSSARSEVLNFIKPPLIALQVEERIGPDEAVRNRVIYETPALEHAGTLDALQAGLRPNDEARVHSNLPVKMLAVDQTVALVPLAQQDTTPVGVLVRESAVLDSLLRLFEYVWASAIPLHVHVAKNEGWQSASALSDKDRGLLSLLLAGLSDEAIAMHRRMSVRTVQRKVHALMEVANVRTRMQLAWEAARRGWLLDADVELEDHPPVAPGENGDALGLEPTAADLLRRGDSVRAGLEPDPERAVIPGTRTGDGSTTP